MQEQSLVGESAPMNRLRGYLVKLAASTANVLIVGETGTGKECVARFLHERGPRHAKPMVSVNCAAIPDALFESELFGYERGAFTGAAGASPGQFRRADGGTLFLDELADMSAAGQAKLLRVLESREVTPLGAKRALPLDVRVLAATNVAPEELLQSRHIRPDLYYRLNVARVDLPPLRQRQQDVLALFDHFAAMLRASSSQPALKLDSGAGECLLRYGWPGNVRELRNLVERILVDPPTGVLTAEYVQTVLQPGPAADVPGPNEEQAKILEALFATHWNKRKAAEQLHWSRMTLYRKLTKYRISRPASAG